MEEEGGRWKRMCPSEVPGKAGPLCFSERWAVCEHLRDTHQRPFKSCPTVNPESLSSRNWGQCQSWFRLPGQWPADITISASLGWELESKATTLHSMPFPSRRTPPDAALRPGGQRKQNEITLLLVQFCPFRRQLDCLELTVLETLFVINYPLFILIYLLNQVPKGVLFVSDVKNPVSWSERGTSWFLICMCLFSWVFHEGESKRARNADHTSGVKVPGLVASVFGFHK